MALEAFLVCQRQQPSHVCVCCENMWGLKPQGAAVPGSTEQTCVMRTGAAGEVQGHPGALTAAQPAVGLAAPGGCNLLPCTLLLLSHDGRKWMWGCWLGDCHTDSLPPLSTHCWGHSPLTHISSLLS